MKPGTTSPAYTGHQTPPNAAYLDNDPTRLILRKPDKLNSICEDCILCGTNCKGTTNQVWTGCVLKPWHPAPQMELVGVRSKHGTNLDGLTQAVALTRKASPENLVTILYSETADTIKAQIRKPGEPLKTPSTYQYITTTAHPLTALDIAREIDTALDLAQDLPF